MDVGFRDALFLKEKIPKSDDTYGKDSDEGMKKFEVTNLNKLDYMKIIF
jgi:hypothetical protein